MQTVGLWVFLLLDSRRELLGPRFFFITPPHTAHGTFHRMDDDDISIFLEKHASRMSKSAREDLKNIFAGKKRKIEELEEEKQGFCSVFEKVLVGDGGMIHLIGQNSFEISVPLECAANSSEVLKNAFDGRTMEATTKQFRLDADQPTLMLLGKAFLLGDARLSNLCSGLSYSALSRVMEASEFLLWKAIFDQAHTALLSEKPAITSLDDAFQTLRFSSTSVWKDQWANLEAGALQYIADHFESATSDQLKVLTTRQMAQTVKMVQPSDNSWNTSKVTLLATTAWPSPKKPSLVLGEESTVSALIHQKRVNSFDLFEGCKLGAAASSLAVCLTATKAGTDSETRREWKASANPVSGRHSDYQVQTLVCGEEDIAFLRSATSIELSWQPLPSKKQFEFRKFKATVDLTQAATLVAAAMELCLVPEGCELFRSVLLPYFSRGFLTHKTFRSKELLKWPASMAKHLIFELGKDPKNRNDANTLKFLIAWSKSKDTDNLSVGDAVQVKLQCSMSDRMSDRISSTLWCRTLAAMGSVSLSLSVHLITRLPLASDRCFVPMHR